MLKKKSTIITILLALVVTTGWAQQKVWDNVVTGHTNVPYFKVTKVAIYDDRTEVFLRLEVPQQMAGESVPLATKPMLTADGKSYAVKGATVISLTEPYIIPAGGKVDFSLIFEPIPENTYMISVAEPNLWSITNVHDADSQPTGIADTYWRNEATGDWLIGFAKQHVIYNNKVWDIVGHTEKKDAYTLTLYDGTAIRVGKMKNGLRQIAIGKNKAIVCSPITGAALPDYPTKDIRKGFVDNGYNPKDSVTIIGWLKDMPEEARRQGGDFKVDVTNFLVDEEETTYTKMDSLGRFTLKMPLLNSSEVFIDWDRSHQRSMLEPGKTYFYLSDFMTGQTLWMGDDVRVQNELFKYPLDWKSIRMEDSDKDFDKYIASVDSLLKAQSAIIDQLCEEHPTLSTRFNTFRKGNTLWQQARDFGQSRFRGPNFQLPDNARHYAYDYFWTKMEKPYTLHSGLSGFLRDYLDDAADARNAVFSYNIRDNYKDFASNDEELALLTRWKKWIDESTAIIEAEPTAEAKERKSHELDSLNADQIKEVDKIVQSPRASKIIHGGLLVNTLKQHQLTLDSLRADPFIKDVWLTRQALSHIDHDRTSLLPNIVDTLKAMIGNPDCIAMIEKQNDQYLAIENREFDKLVLKSSDNLADLSEGEALLKKILEPYKGKFVLLDIWGTWCGPCKEALSHSTEEYARLKDYDIQYLYLANESPQTSWENVIKEYNVSGPNVAHYNLPREQQAAIEHHLGVHAWPTYKLFNRDGELLDLKVSAFDLEGLAGLLEQLK